MSESPKSSDPRERPYDPAGTRPRHDPKDIVPRARDVDPEAAARGSALWAARDQEPEPRDTEPRAMSSATVEPAAAREAPQIAAHPELAPVRPPGTSLPARAATRIRVLLGALTAIGAAGVVAVVLIAVGSGGDSGPAGPQWSAWEPDGSGDERVEEIAARISRQYRGADGGQLVVATGGPLEIAGLPLTVALREPATQGGDIDIEDGEGILFRLCGLGADCAIAAGKPSTERHLLLRREALELALYTFRYVDVEQVVVFMPPPAGRKPDEALFFQRGDLEPQIERPLAQSLAPQTPSVTTVTSSPDAPLVQDITLETLFKFSLTPGNSDDRAFLVLDPLSG